MFVDILISFLLQVVFTVGLLMLFGWLISLCNRKFYGNFGGLSNAVCYVTGFVGTPVHELSHALFCIIFGHRIVEIKLFRISPSDGNLGYVRHTYNPKNVYQKIGNFFIGVAPVIVISAILYLLAMALLPDFIGGVYGLNASVDIARPHTVFVYVWEIAKNFFACALTWQWWVFVLIGIFLSLHMTLSGADIKSAVSGLVLLLVALLAVDIILGLVNVELLASFTRGVISVGAGLLCFLLLALMISVVAVGISFIVKLLRRV